MGVQFYSPRNNWCVQWQENGVRRKRYFKTEQEAHAFERERLEQKEGPRQLTLGELVALYFRSNPDKHPKTRKNIVYFFAGHEDRKRGSILREQGSSSGTSTPNALIVPIWKPCAKHSGHAEQAMPQ